jgi:hypothetical protein
MIVSRETGQYHDGSPLSSKIDFHVKQLKL